MQDYSSFVRLVHDVYPRLHDRAFLQDHALSRLLGGGSPYSAERLHRTLIDALEWLRPLGSVSTSSVEWRRFSHLQMRYVEGATPEQIAHELQVSPRQARRDHVEALDEVARLLWTRLGRLAAPPSERPAQTGSPGDSLDAEISTLNATAPAEPTDVGALVSGVVGTISRLAQVNAVRITVVAPELIGPIVVNRTVLRQLLLNLLSDAIVNRPAEEIRIDVGRREGSIDVTIAVTDDRRGNLSRTKGQYDAQPGIWPGVIAVSARLAQSLGASLRSEARSSGDIVCLTLPSGHASTLLLVDDNPDVALLFRRYLANTEYRLVQARSAERALRLARELRPELVILDVLMPSHDGWEILQALRGDPATERIPVVICSVIPDHALAYSLGVTDFLSKPVTRPALLEVLSRLRGQGSTDDRGDPPEPTDTARPRGARPPD